MNTNTGYCKDTTLYLTPTVHSPTHCTTRITTYTYCTVCILYGCLQRVTIPEAVVIQFVLLRMSSVLLETC